MMLSTFFDRNFELSNGNIIVASLLQCSSKSCKANSSSMVLSKSVSATLRIIKEIDPLRTCNKRNTSSHIEVRRKLNSCCAFSSCPTKIPCSCKFFAFANVLMIISLYNFAISLPRCAVVTSFSIAITNWASELMNFLPKPKWVFLVAYTFLKFCLIVTFKSFF